MIRSAESWQAPIANVSGSLDLRPFLDANLWRMALIEGWGIVNATSQRAAAYSDRNILTDSHAGNDRFWTHNIRAVTVRADLVLSACRLCCFRLVHVLHRPGFGSSPQWVPQRLACNESALTLHRSGDHDVNLLHWPLHSSSRGTVRHSTVRWRHHCRLLDPNVFGHRLLLHR